MKKSNLPLQEEWLGNDLKAWSQSIRNGYARAFILFALHDTGVFELLRKGNPLTVSQIASQCNLLPSLLDGVMNFLYFSDKILIKKGGRFSLSRYGKEYLFTDTVLTMSYGAIGAASCLLYELAPCLRGEKKYGRDFCRPGDLVAKGSFYTSKQNYSWVVDELVGLGVKNVADLGCGSADILINFCRLNSKIQGTGIDISAGALQEASKIISSAGFSNRIRLVHADITKPSTYKNNLKNIGAFNAIMVIHEFLQNGQQKVIDMLKSMKRLFPGRYFFIGELDPPSEKEYSSMPYPDRIHPLFAHFLSHPLTRGGYCMKKEQWVKLFNKAGIEIVKIKDDFYPSRLIEYVLRF